MSSGDIESQPSAGRGGSLLPAGGVSRKWKIILAAAFLVGAVAVVGVCATAVGLGVVGTRDARSGGEESTSQGERRSLGINDGEVVSCSCYVAMYAVFIAEWFQL